MDPVDQSIVITTRQVGSSNTALKYHIPAQDYFLCLTIEYYMPSSVTGSMVNIELVNTQTESLPMEQVNGGLRTGVE